MWERHFVGITTLEGLIAKFEELGYEVYGNLNGFLSSLYDEAHKTTTGINIVIEDPDAGEKAKVFVPLEEPTHRDNLKFLLIGGGAE